MSAKGLKAENAITEAGLLVKRGTANDEFTPTTASNDTVLGVVSRKVGVDEYAAVHVEPGVYLLRADGAISQDAEVMPSATSGKNGYVATAATTGNTIVGKALQDAADGDLFEVLYYANHGAVA